MKKFCFLLLIATLLFSCKQGGQQNKKNDDKPVITVTIEPLRYFTEAIAGDEFTVVSMVPKGSSPEDFFLPHSRLLFGCKSIEVDNVERRFINH